MKLPGRGSKAIGLDIGSESVRVVELAGGANPRVLKMGSVKIAKGLVVDGEIADVNDVSRAIRQLWKETGIQNRRVTVGVANPKVIARQVELPYMEADALKGAIRFQAQEFVPISPENLILDYQIIGEVEGQDGVRMLKVLLVAAHRDMVEKFTDAIEKAGLFPWIVYLSSLAMVRALVRRPKAPAEAENGDGVSQVIVNIGAGISNVVVADRGITRFARVITFGGDDLTRAVSEQLGVDVAQAEELKMSYGLPDSLAPAQSTEEQGERVMEVLQREAYKFVDEVRRSVEYYFSQDISTLRIDEIILSGGASQMRNLPEFISEALGIDVRIGDPFLVAAIDEKLKKRSLSKGFSPLSFVPAVGLGIRGLEG